MAMKKKGAAKGGVRKMRGGSKVVKEKLAAKRSAATKNKIENDRTKAKNASITDMGKFDSPSAKKRRAADAKAFAAERKRLADKRKNKLMSKGVGSGDDRYTQAVEVYDNTGIRDHYEQPSHLGGRKRKITDPNTMPNGMPKINPGRRYDISDVARGFKDGGKVAKKKAGGAVTKKMGGGKMMKKGYAKGGKLAKMSKGGRGTIARGSGAARPQRFRKNG